MKCLQCAFMCSRHRTKKSEEVGDGAAEDEEVDKNHELEVSSSYYTDLRVLSTAPLLSLIHISEPTRPY